jgi:hypothetical protein
MRQKNPGECGGRKEVRGYSIGSKQSTYGFGALLEKLLVLAQDCGRERHGGRGRLVGHGARTVTRQPTEEELARDIT